MGLFSKIKKAFKKGRKGLTKLVKGAGKVTKAGLIGGPAAAAVVAGKEVFDKTKKKPGSPPAISDALEVDRINAAASEADREERVKRARQALRSGTIRTSTLGSPLSGVSLTRPKLSG